MPAPTRLLARHPAGAGESGGTVTAVLGPTNTGKTHYAITRMLGHAGGIIGLPLRLLAREVYDRVAAEKGAASVALITGEEKIVPAHPRWYVCTVEAMPLDLSVSFVAVDEIQLCADPERGHVFTDRLLRARGTEETLFLGADTARDLVRTLVPGVRFVNRTRLSTLAYSGQKKLSRLPPRSAIVAFSAADVYALAELVRRQRGGAAVVLGALSPRTRNAQVALYQNRDVDYLVATDAIGMGLNMDIDHVALAGLRKFDGEQLRPLHAAEVGQIAGRAGRHMRDGSFGTTADLGPLDPELIERLELHQFDALKRARWRNPALEFRSLGHLRDSLERAPPHARLQRGRECDDERALRSLAQDAEIAALAAAPARVRLLWEVCGVPDFRKTMPEAHVRLLKRLFLHLAGPDEVLPVDWVARSIARLDRTEGDIDTLATRIAHIRTWTYVSHRRDWLVDSQHWQERARAIEDRLSDALHERLTQRFVDRRSSMLIRKLREHSALEAVVRRDGEVTVEGAYMGRLTGLRFVPDEGGSGPEVRMMEAAARRGLHPALGQRARWLEAAPDAAFALDAAQARIDWDQGDGPVPVAQLAAGPAPLRPAIRLLAHDALPQALAERVEARLAAWLDGHVRAVLAPLFRLQRVAAENGALSGPGRGLAFRLQESLGAVPWQAMRDLQQDVGREDRRTLLRLGVRIGLAGAYLEPLLKPAATSLKCCLYSVHAGLVPRPLLPRPGLTSLATAEAGPVAPPEGWWTAAGFALCGARAVRFDMLDRIAIAARRLERKGPFPPEPALMSLLGGGMAELSDALQALGYRRIGGAPADYRFVRGRRAGGPGPSRTAPSSKRKPAGDASPFAALRHLAQPAGQGERSDAGTSPSRKDGREKPLQGRAARRSRDKGRTARP